MHRSRFAPRALRLPGLAAALAVAAVALSSAPAAAQGQGTTTLDLAPTGFHVTQAIQSGNTRLAGGRSTMVRVGVRALGEFAPGTVYDGVLHVHDGGVEIEGSPFYSDNGPLVPTPLPDLTVLDGTLNFIVVPPTSADVVFTVDVNPAGPNQIAETSYANNVLSSQPQDFQCREDPEIVFVPIDYQFATPGVPNLPDAALIKPGVGDAFYQGIYPAPDAHYHRSVAPKKIWTKSLASSSGGVDLDVALAADMQLMVPVPDFIYGWAPGPLPGYNGVAIGIPGVAAMGNTDPIRHQRTMAHELGHLFGLSHNSALANVVGIDVEHHLNLTEGLPVLKPASLKDVMYAGLLTHEAWVREASYNVFFDNASMQCTPEPATDGAPPARLLLAGTQDYAAKSVALHAAFVVEGGRSTPFVSPAAADLILHVFTGETLAAELGITTRTSADCPACGGGDAEHSGGEHADAGSTADEETATTPIGGFATLLPGGLDPARITRVAFVDPASGATLHALDRSAHAPNVRFGAVTAGADGEALVTWSATDADGDALSSFLRYSHDGGRITPLATGLDVQRAVIDAAALPKLEPGSGYFEVMVSDGLHTTTARHYPSADESADLGGDGGAAPHCFLYSPDDGKTYPLGANVVLHAHAWDIEDGRLDDGSVVWTSDVDGALATGRLTTTAALSVGVHTLTVTATDGGGGFKSDSAVITITDRALPGGGTCQTDLGFGGPGDAELALCGGDLSAGTFADLALSGAAAAQPMWVAVSSTSSPTALLGGTLVAFPPTVVVPAVTDANGDFLLADAVAGGGGPFTLYLQAAYLDPTQVLGIGISNAVQADVLP